MMLAILAVVYWGAVVGFYVTLWHFTYTVSPTHALIALLLFSIAKINKASIDSILEQILQKKLLEQSQRKSNESHL